MTKAKKKTTEPKKTGRPKLEINWDEFDKLCVIQCTLEEIAGWFNVSTDTIERRVMETHGVTFAEHFAKKSAKGKISLRRVQWQKAMGGCVPLMIFLGKQVLGQSDKVDHSGNEARPFVLKYTVKD